MSRYFFGSLFVRFAKIIAAVVLFGGVGGAAVRYAQASMEAAQVRYEPSASFGAKLFALGRDWHRTKQLIDQFLGQSAPPMTDVSFSNAPSSPAEFAKFTAQLTTLQSERDAAKETIVRRFETQVTQIERKLRAHASELAEAQEPAPKPKPAKLPNVEPAGVAESKTLFDALSSGEVTTRRDLLTEGQEFISLLKTSAENPENAATLAGALDELAIFEKFLPPTLVIAPRPAPQNEAPAVVPSRPKLNAERVADQLEQLRTLIRSALLKDWSIDRALAQAAGDVETEQKRCLESTRAVKTLWLNAGIFIAVAVSCSVLGSFFILVLADVAKASMDAALSASVLASAAQYPAPTGKKNPAPSDQGGTES